MAVQRITGIALTRMETASVSIWQMLVTGNILPLILLLSRKITTILIVGDVTMLAFKKVIHHALFKAACAA